MGGRLIDYIFGYEYWGWPPIRGEKKEPIFFRIGSVYTKTLIWTAPYLSWSPYGQRVEFWNYPKICLYQPTKNIAAEIFTSHIFCLKIPRWWYFWKHLFLSSSPKLADAGPWRYFRLMICGTKNEQKKHTHIIIWLGYQTQNII